jgi:hypothetical protein
MAVLKTDARIVTSDDTLEIEQTDALPNLMDGITLLFQQIDIALKNQWFRQNRNFLSVLLTY